MSKKRNLIIGLSLLSVSSAFVASCNAPGSSLPIQAEDPKINLTTDNQELEQNAPKIKSATQQANNDESFLPKIFTDRVDSNSDKLVSEHYIKKENKINYVAFGDSITAGFDGTLPRDYQGEKTQSGAIDGLSYPAFLARLLNHENRVNEFKNFAYSGTTILDWIKFLGVDYQTDNKSEFFKNVYNSQFSSELADFKTRLARANLVTFTLGANDFFELIAKNIQNYNLIDIFKTLISKEPSYGELIKFVNSVLGNALSEINQRINTLIANIKALAPQANINIVSYPAPLLGLKEIFDSYLKHIFGNLPINISPLDYLVGVLNSTLKSAARFSSINYVDLYNSKYWTKNADELSTVLLDIHPNTLGYKKMAMDLYLKLTTNKLGVKNYQGYDFNKEFLLTDSDTLQAQIEPNQNPIQAIGDSSQSYLENQSTFEIQINPLRNEKYFGERVSDLVSIFGELLSSKGIKDSFYNLQVQLRELKASKTLTLDAIPKLLLSNFLNEANIVKLISVVAKSDLIKENKERINRLLESLLSNGLSTYSEEIVQFLTTKIEQVTKDKLKESSVKSVLRKIVSDKNFVTLLKNIANIFINHSVNFEQVQSYKDVLLAFLKNDQDFESLSDSISKIAGYIFENPEMQDLFADIFHQYLVDNHLSQNISSTQTSKFTKDFLNFASTSLLKDNLLKEIIKGILDDLSVNPNTDFSSVIKSAFNNVLGTLFDFSNNNPKLMNLLHGLFNSNLINQNKNLIKQLIKNVLNSSQEWLPSLVMKALPSSFAEQLYKYGGEKNLALLIKHIFSLEKSKTIVNDIVASLVDNTQQFANFSSFDQLVQKILKTINLDSIQTNLKAIINELLSSSQFTKITSNLLLNALGQIGLNTSDLAVFEFANNVSGSIKSLLDYLGLTDQIIQKVFENFKKAQSSLTPIEILGTIPQEISQLISQKVTQDTFEFVKGLMKLPLVNSQNFKQVFVQVVDKLWNKVNPANFISKSLISLLTPQLDQPSYAKYLDKDEAIDFIHKMVKTNGFKDVILDSVSYIIKNPVWNTDVKSFNEVFIALLKEPELKGAFKDSLGHLVDDTLSVVSLNKTFAKTINVLLEKYSISLDEIKLQTLGSGIGTFIKDVINKGNLKDPLIDALFDHLANSQNFDQIQAQLQNTLVTALDFDSNPLLLSAILDSPLVSSQKETIKEIFDEFLQKMRTSNQKGKFLSDLGLSSLIAQNITTQNEIDNLAQLLFADNQFILLVKKLFNHILDNAKELAKSNSFIEFLDGLSYKQDLILEFKQPLIDLVKQNLENNLVKKTISSTFYKFLVKQHLDNNLDEQGTHNAIGELISFVKNNSLVTSFISNLINDLIDNSYHAGWSQLPDIISRSLNSAAEKTFNLSQQSNLNKVIELINDITSSQLLQNHKDYFKTLLNNIVEHLSQLNVGSVFTGLLPGPTQTFISNSITDEKFNSLINLIFSLDDTKTILKEVINGVLDSYQTIQNAISLEDLVSKVIKTVNFEKIKTSAKNLLASLIGKSEFQPLFKTILTELYSYLKLDPNSSHNSQFIEGFARNFKTIIDSFDILDPLIDKLFEKISSAKNSSNPISVLNTIPQAIGEIFAQKVTNKPKDFIQKIFDLSIFSSNKQALADLLKAVYGIALENQVFDNLILNTLIPTLLKSPAKDYVDATEIGDLLLRIIRTDSLKDFIFTIIDSVINNNDWINHLNSPKELVNSILKIPSLINNVKQHITPLLKELLQNNKLNVTVSKLLNKVASSYGINFNIDQLSTVAQNVLTSIIPYLESTGTLEKLINNIFALIEQEKDVDKILSNLTHTITSSFDFSSFGLIQHLLSSNLFKKETDSLKLLSMSFVDQISTKDTYTNLVDQIDISSTVSSLSLSSDQITNLNHFVREILKDNEFIQLIKALIPSFIDHAGEYASANDHVELALQALKNVDFLQAAKAHISALLRKTFQNTNVQSVLASILHSKIQNSPYNWVLNQVQSPQELFSALLALFNDFETEFGIIDKSFQALNEFAQDSHANSIQDLVNKLINQFSVLLNSNNLETNIIKLVHLIADRLLPTNKDKFNKIAENIFIKIKDDAQFVNSLISLIPSDLKTQIQVYISDENLKYTIQKLFSSDKFKEFVLTGISSTLQDKNAIKQANSFNELLKLLLSKLDITNKAKEAFKELVTKYKADTKLKEIAKFALTKALSSAVGIDNLNSSELEQFSDDVSQNLVDLLNNLGIYNTLVDGLFSRLSTVISAKNPDFNGQLFVHLTTIITNKFSENPQHFLNQVISSKIFTNNKQAIKAILMFVAKKLIQQGTITAFINEEIESLQGNLDNYLDKDALKALVTELVKVENLEQLVSFMINYLIDHTEWTNSLDTIQELVFKILKDSQVLNSQKSQIESLITKTLDSSNLDKIILKVANKLLTSQGYSQTINLDLASGIRNFIQEFNNKDAQSTFVNKLLNNLEQKVQSSNSIDQVIDEFIPTLPQTLKLQNFNIVKALINSSLLQGNNKQSVKEILKFFFNKHYTTANIEKIVALIPLDLIAQKIGDTKEHLKTTFTNILSNDNVKQMVNKIIDFVVDRVDIFANASSYNELIKIAFAQKEFTSSIKQHFVDLLNIAVKDQEFRKVLSKLLTNALNDQQANKILNGIDDKSRIVNNLLSVFDIFDQQLGISSIAFESVIDFLKVNGLDFGNIISIASSIVNGVKNVFAQDTENKVTGLIRTLSSSKLLNENKNDLLTIFDNVFKTLDSQEFANMIEGSLGEQLKAQLIKFIPLNSFKELIKFIHSNSHFKSVLTTVIRKSIEKFNEYSNVKSYADIIDKTFEIIDVAELESGLRSLVKDILSTKEIKDIVLQFLKTTLKTYDVRIDEQDVNEFLTQFAYHFDVIIDSLNITNPILNRVFEILKSKRFKEKPSDEVARIIPSIRQSFFFSPRGIWDKLSGWSSWGSGILGGLKTGLDKTISQLTGGLIKHGVISNWIKPKINALDINKPIFRYISKEDLNALIDSALKYPSVTEIVNAVVPQITSGAISLSTSNDILGIVFSIIKNQSIFSKFKEQGKTILESLLKEPIVQKVVAGALNSFLDQHNISISNFDKQAFTKATLENAVSILKSANLYDKIYDKLFDVLNNSNNFEDFISQAIPEIVNIIAGSHFELTKAILSSQYLQSQKEQYRNLINSLIYWASTHSNELEALLDKLNLNGFLAHYNLTNNELAQAISEFLGITPIQNALNVISNKVLDNASNIANGSSYNEWVKTIFAENNSTNLVKQNIKNGLPILLGNETIKNTLAKVVVQVIKDHNLTWLFDNVAQPNQLITSLLDSVLVLNEESDLFSNVIDKGIEILQTQGFRGDFSPVLDLLVEKFKTLITGGNAQANLLKLLKGFARSDAFTQSSEDLKELLNNIFTYFIQKTDFGTLVLGLIPQDSRDWINKNLFDPQMLVQIINHGAKSSTLQGIIKDIIFFIVDHPEHVTSATYLNDIFKQYFSTSTNVTYVQQRFTQVVTETFALPQSVNAIKSALTKFFTFIEINTNPEINKIIDLVANGFIPLLQRIGLFDRFVDGAVNFIRTQNEFSLASLKAFVQSLINSIQPTEYGLFKKLIGDELITNNKNLIKSAFHKIVDSFVNRPGKLEAIMQTLGVGGAVVSYDSQTINNMFINIIRNSNIVNVLKTILDNLVTNNLEYKKLNSWPEAFNYFIRHTNDQSIKNNLTNWFQSVARNNNSYLAQGVGAILHSKLKAYGYNLNNNDDLNMMKQVANGMLKTLANDRSMTNTIINKLLSNIKSIDFTKVYDPTFTIAKVFMISAFSPLLDSTNEKILTSKILDLGGFLSKITENIGAETYVKFINRLFDSSSLDQVTGVYKFLNGLLNLNLVPSYRSVKINSRTKVPHIIDYYWNKPFEPSVKFNSYNIFTLKSRVSEFIKPFFKQIFVKIFTDYTTNKWNINSPKVNDGYKALYRIHVFLLWLLHDNNVPLFWNGTWDNVEAYVSLGQQKGWNDVFNSFKSRISNNGKVLESLGSNHTSWGRRWFNRYYTMGSDWSRINNSNYANNQILAYIYYRTKNPQDRHNKSKTKTRVLLESLQNGYIGNPTRIDKSK
ncbi:MULTISPECIES: SGNH/GDSL hydrolase family protein [unclassified Mycoplasma]|uniref:SGNH/GDSL hydrolase family protein n=1 Tax=unclassified Mycoplasma TaxID=2683645 RepID=UPI00211B823D|nr:MULTISPECIES: SGNH/GDSL hydrolase family protein [unclassified Mycoplasma]UUM19679.1 SGNH/GDSL hydrolase family protein [Mycoplasma sp. 1578d]UUM24662.1 SGNH/GDSL hydrolase family protein [Mycoplasma sp. 3686d]